MQRANNQMLEKHCSHSRAFPRLMGASQGQIVLIELRFKLTRKRNDTHERVILQVPRREKKTAKRGTKSVCEANKRSLFLFYVILFLFFLGGGCLSVQHK